MSFFQMIVLGGVAVGLLVILWPKIQQFLKSAGVQAPSLPDINFPDLIHEKSCLDKAIELAQCEEITIENRTQIAEKVIPDLLLKRGNKPS